MANYVYNSASSGEKYNAKCLNVSDDSEWTPSVAEYPEDGTIDLSGGTSGRYLDTQWVAPQDTEWTMSGIYNVVMDVSYDMYSIHYKGNQTCDIYLGSSTEDLVLSESDKDYTPPTGNWIIEEEPPAIIGTSAYTVYIAIQNEEPTNTMPAGITVSKVFDNTDITTVHPLVDLYNNPVLCTIQNKSEWNAAANSATTGDNSGVVTDYQMERGWRNYAQVNDVDIYLEAGTYDVQVYGSSSLGYADFTFNGETKAQDQLTNPSPNITTFTNVVSTGEVFTLTTAINALEDRCYLNAINLIKDGGDVPDIGLAPGWATDTWYSERDNTLVEQNGSTVKVTAGNYPTFTETIQELRLNVTGFEDNTTYRVIMELSTNNYTNVSLRDSVYDQDSGQYYPISIDPDITGLTNVEYTFTTGVDAGTCRIYMMFSGTFAIGQVMELIDFSVKEDA